MSNFDSIKNKEGKEFLIFDSSELYDNTQMGNKSEDFEIIQLLGKGGFGQVFKVISKFNTKVYAMKKLDLVEIEHKFKEKGIILTENETKFLEMLPHPHIIKYYKSFKEGDFLYIITEYARNGDLKDFIEAHKIFNKHIPEEEIWNIFLQSMEALEYIHRKDVIHRDIKPQNIFIDNNMVIKIGDFGTSAIKRESIQGIFLFKNKDEEKMIYGGTEINSPGYTAKEVTTHNYGHKIDVYSMGVTFYEMCFFHKPIFKQVFDQFNNSIFIIEETKEDKKVNYSKELLNIIYLMLEQDKNKRKSSSEILKMVQDEYSKKFFRNTSIDSIIRCLFSCNSLTNKFLNNSINQLQNKPITREYINCLQCVTKPSLAEWINAINYFRKILGYQNPKLEGNKEIDPRLVFAFLVKELHFELNNSTYLSNNNKHLLVSGEEISKISKVEMMIKFVNEILSKINSIISNELLGLINITNQCNACNIKTFSFNNYFFITINLEKILGNNYNVPQINLLDNLYFQNEISELYCSKCLNKTMHTIFKNYYSFPNLLIFSIQRGITYQYKTKIIIQDKLDLSQLSGFQYSNNFYNLVGILKRIIKNGNETFFSIIFFNQRWYLCEGAKVIETMSPLLFDPDGDTIMLFYEKIM